MPSLFARPLGALRRLAACRGGAAALETALLLVVFLQFIVGTIQFGHMMWVRSNMQYAVEEAGRYASVNPTATATQVRDVAAGKIADTGITGIAFTAASSTVGTVKYMTVSAAYTYTFSLPMITLGTLPLSASAKVPQVD